MPTKTIAYICIFLASALGVNAQKELHISQYMHNRYTVNTAFGGSGEALTVFGAYRKQWAGIKGAPQSQLVSAHTPLKNDQIALGIELFNQQFGATKNSGFSASYTYRFRQGQSNKLAISTNVGAAFVTSEWNNVDVFDPTDPLFSQKENQLSPIIGLGAAWYGKKFFAGVSIPSLVYTDIYTTGETSFSPDKAEYIATAGYLMDLSESLQLQPSALLRVNTPYGSIYDVNATFMWQAFIWAGASYRSTDEVTVMLAVQPIARFRLAYSIDLSTGEVGRYNNGTHEISLRYHFGYKIQTVSPKFF